MWCCSYDIELLEFEPPEEDKEQEMMTFEERLEAAERRRLEGNELFKGDKFKEALSRYRCMKLFQLQQSCTPRLACLSHAGPLNGRT